MLTRTLISLTKHSKLKMTINIHVKQSDSKKLYPTKEIIRQKHKIDSAERFTDIGELFTQFQILTAI